MNGRSERRIALRITAAFAVSGVAWVLLTDVILYELVSDPVLLARLETAKGWTFVALATVLLYVIGLRSAGRLARAHRTLSAVIDSIADGLLLLGADRTITRTNPAAARILNCDALVGMDAKAFARRFRVSRPDGSLVRPERLISQRVFDEGGPLHHKVVLHPSDAAEIVLSATAAAVRHSMDTPVELVVSVMHDITATEHLERLRDQFFAAAAHTLKTPVAIIKANAHTLTAEDPALLEESSAAIVRQCVRIDRLVQNLLVLARVRTQTLQLHTTELELVPLVEQVSAEMASASPRTELRTAVQASPRVHGDTERLGLALSNLIDEALRASPRSSIVTVSVTQRGATALIGVSRRPKSRSLRSAEPASPDNFGEYDERAIERLVAETIVAAHAGSVREESSGSHVVSWISLPTTVAPDAHR